MDEQPPDVAHDIPHTNLLLGELIGSDPPAVIGRLLRCHDTRRTAFVSPAEVADLLSFIGTLLDCLRAAAGLADDAAPQLACCLCGMPPAPMLCQSCLCAVLERLEKTVPG